MPKILIDENIPLLRNALSDSLSVDSISGRHIDNGLLISGNYDALIVRSITKINEALLRNTNVRFVGTATSGTDHIDIEYLSKNGIAFHYAPGSNANSVAEYVVFSILEWGKSKGISVTGKTIGIVGFGNIGKIVADYAHRMGLTVLVNDPPLKDEGYKFPDYIRYSELDEIIVSCDIITNHVPLNQTGNYPTFQLINNERIGKLRTNSLLLHTSRGFVVDESVLLKRLEKREISAVIDVWENEPLINDVLMKYCFLATPHIAGYSYDGKLKGALMMAKAVESHFGLRTKKEIISIALDSGIEKIQMNDDIDFILHSLEKNRNFNEDYVLFLRSMLLEPNDRKKEFDCLRKDYPIRRECLY